MSSEGTARANQKEETKPFLYVSAAAEAEVSAGAEEVAAPWGEAEPAVRVNVEEKEKEAFEHGAQEGETRARAAFEKQAAAMRMAAAKSLEEFKSQRVAYFARVEPEIVQLSLAIARKILHREAQMDPLLLTGMVHVALEKLDMGTHVRLRVNPADIHFWKEYFAHAAANAGRPELVGDETLAQGECAIETEIGSTQISLETQLKEIEQGFFDLLDQRPRVR